MLRSPLCAQAVFVLPLLLLALTVRLGPWGDNRFLEDEALYAYWGLQIATGADPMLDREPVDKPPLHPYTLALSFLLLGQNETAARVPSLLASVTGVALIYALGRALYGDSRVGLWAALLVALSPFDLLFASTAFTDPLLTVLILGALFAAARAHLGLAGLLIGLAAATKQQGLLFLPLAVAVGLFSRRQMPDRRHTAWPRFALGLMLVAAGVVIWDLSRLQRPGFWYQGLVSYGGIEPAPTGTLIERGLDWLRLFGDFWASPALNTVLLVLVGLWLLGGWAGWLAGPSTLDVILATFVTIFLAIHWLVGFQVWDRYLLPLVPLAALLAARALVALGDTLRPRLRRIYPAALAGLLGILLAGSVWQGVHSRLPLGGDHGAYDGIDEVATYLRAQAPPGAVLYHHWLGYHYRFYLYGAPLRFHWYPETEDLVQDAIVYRREPRFIAFPSWRSSAQQRAALASAGIHLQPVVETVRRDGSTSFRLYRLEGP